MSECSLQFENVCKVFGEGTNARTVVKNVSFSVKDGEFFSILGPSGCGKSTLLKEVYKNYNKFLGEAKKQSYFSKTNFSLEKMEEKLKEVLEKVNINTLTPVEALMKLDELRKLL